MQKILYRSWASFVTARLGISPIPPISSKQLHLNPSRGGLIIAGLYVLKTTTQLAISRERSSDGYETVKIKLSKLLASSKWSEEELQRALSRRIRT
ncbi:hypothetical protein CC78DRAFT_51625 [Lojkania enalia]|uniref:Uncharacterized protein n=1 Tax=Lojkania enalia TaxID=147567 RepID=A0A9P4K5B8_9PLEO|nr:hypothetical protein CC78DRAFT_51625 [Didymosphaeria enalia]